MITNTFDSTSLMNASRTNYEGMRRKVLQNPLIHVAFRRPTQCNKFEYQYQRVAAVCCAHKALLFCVHAECIVTCCYHLSYFHIHGCANLLIAGARMHRSYIMI